MKHLLNAYAQTTAWKNTLAYFATPQVTKKNIIVKNILSLSQNKEVKYNICEQGKILDYAKHTLA